MDYEELIRRLRARPALIVHFSHHANMRDGGVFPADLNAAIVNSRLWPLSCCLVWPTHNMSLPGSVGIVLRPRSVASILGIGARDGGYHTLADGTENGGGEPLSEETFDGSFDVAQGAYNEWRVRESDVVGIYWEGDPDALGVKKHQPLCDGDTGQVIDQIIGVKSIPLADVHAEFPDLPVYTRSARQNLFQASRIPGSTVYPWI